MNHTKKQNRILPVIYTACFVLLCVINWVQITMDGRIQFIAANLTGVVMAVIILSAYSFRDFKKPVFIVWSGIVLTGAPIALYWGRIHYPYWGKWITAVLNCCIYGYILILVLTKQVKKTTRSKRNWPLFFCWLLMILLMVISPNESVWPLWFGVMFGSLYLTDYKEKQKEMLVNSLLDGILIGFVMMQTCAFLFRPYDDARYAGPFIGCNFNALFYLTVYTAFLCKLLIRRKQGTGIFEQILWFVCAGMMFGFILVTGCRTILVALPVVAALLLAGMILSEKRKLRFTLVFLSGSLLTFIVSVPVVYCLIRFLPTIANHPVYFISEWSEEKVHRGDPWDSPKYVSFEEMLQEDVGRILWFLPGMENKENVDEEINDETDREPVYPEDEGKYIYEEYTKLSTIEEREVIWKYYIKQLRIWGHSYNDDGVPVSPNYHGWHAHNYLIQMSFWFGIPVGLLLLGFFIACFVKYVELLKKKQYVYACILAGFVAVFALYGLFESSWGIGHLNHTLFYALLYMVFYRIPAELSLTGENKND